MAVSLSAKLGYAEEPEVIPVWPSGVPGGIADAKGEYLDKPAEGHLTNVHVPVLLHTAPTRPNGAALIVCPGGGYRILSMKNEGRAVAEWLAPQGVRVFVLKSRLKEYKFPAQLQDVLQAVRIVRARSAEWGVDPKRIGVLGFSAGGHLASMAATLFDDPAGKVEGQAYADVSARPDFAGLVYPVISMEAGVTHGGSRDNLLGKNPSAELVQRTSTDRQVTARTPPTFLVHTGVDTAVPVENSLRFYQALQKAKVPAELHVYPVGPHGFGLKPGFGATSDWPRRFEEWLRDRGLLAPASP